jgi:glycosyltransferase involved in cell wall biosynthesis
LSRKLPEIVATMMVRDEQDVIAANLEHHLHAGVPHIVVTDNGSIDGTREILAQYAKTGFVTLLDDPVQKKQQSKVVSRMAMLAARRGAKYLVHLDADEFLVTTDEPIDRLPDVIREEFATAKVLEIERTNMVGPADSQDDDGTSWLDRLIYRERVSLSLQGKPLMPKIAHKASILVRVAQGNHRIRGVGLGEPQLSSSLHIVHYPMRSWRQFSTKIENSGTAYAANPSFSAAVGAHLKADYARLLDGTLYSEYLARAVDGDRLRERLASSEVKRDVRLRDELHDLKNGLGRQPGLIRVSA